MSSPTFGQRFAGLFSRKFLIVVAATVAMFMKIIGGLEWVGIVTAYLAADQYQTHQERKGDLG